MINQSQFFGQGLSVDSESLSCPGLMQVSVTGGTPGYKYIWEVKDANGNWVVYVDADGYRYTGINDLGSNQVNVRRVAGADPGVYKITIEDQNGLTNSVQLTLTPPVDLDARIDFQGLICSEEPVSGLLLLEFINGFADYTWVLSQGASEIRNGVVSGSNYLVIEGLNVGVYTLDWTDANLCTGSKTVTIAAPDQPLDLNLNIVQNVSCPGGNDGEVSLGFLGGWTEISETDSDQKKYMFELYRDGTLVQQWLNTEATRNIVNLEAGNYQIRYTDRVNENNSRRPFSEYDFDSDSFRCTKSQSFTITEPAPFELNLTATVAVCQGDTNGEITITPSGGTPNYEINFFSGHFDNPNNPVVDNNDMTLLAGSPITNVSAGQLIGVQGLAAGNYAVLLKDANGCLKAQNVTIIENPLGQVDPINEITVCSGEFIEQIFTTSETTGTTRYEWTNSNPAIGLAANGAGNLSFTAINSTNTSITATITVTPTLDLNDISCTGTPEVFTLTVNPLGQVGSIVDQEVCMGANTQEVIFTTQNTGGTTTYGWIMSTDIGAGLSGSGDIAGFTTVNNTNASIVSTVTVTPTYSIGSITCEGAPETFTITVNPVAEVVATPVSEDICSQEATNIDLSTPTTGTESVTYSWTAVESQTPTGGQITGFSDHTDKTLSEIIQTLTNSGTSPGVVTYTITPHIGGCTGTPITVDVTVNPLGQVGSIVDQEVCMGANTQEVIFTTQNTGGTTTYGWIMSTDIGAGLSGSGDIAGFTTVNNTNASIVSTVTVTPTYSIGSITCEGAPETFTITVNPTPVIGNKTDEICSDDSFSVVPLNINGDIVPNGTVYSWQVLAPNTNIIGASSGSGSIISEELTNTSNISQVVVYEVTPITSSIVACEGASFEIEVTVLPRPTLLDRNFDICSGETFTYNPVNNPPNEIVPAGTTYTWNFVDNPNINGETNGTNENQFEQFNLLNISNTDQVVVYQVTASSGICTSSFEIKIIVKPTPFIPYASGLTDTRCSGDFFVIDPVNGIPDATYIVPNNTTYTWVVVPNNSLSGWSDNSVQTSLISQQLVNLTNTPQNIEYLITPSNGTCEGPVFSVNIWIEPKPSIPDHLETVCDGDSFVFAPVNGAFPDSTTIVPYVTLYSWVVTDVSGGNISGYSNGIDQQFIDSGVLLNNSAAIQTLIYQVTPTYYNASNPGVAQCVGDSFSITVTVNPGIEDNAIVTNISCNYSPLCGGSIELNPVGIGTLTYLWSYTGTGINAISNPTLKDQNNLCPGNYSVAITDSLGCTYSFDYVIAPPLPVTFNLISLVDLSCNNISPSCDGSIEVIPQGGTAPYTLLEWYTESIPGSGNFDTIVETGDSELNNACEGNYVLKVLDTNGCEFTSPIYTISQTASPILISQTISNYKGYEVSCLGANDGFINVSVSGGSGSFTYSLSPGGILDSDLSTPNVLEFRNLQAGTYTLTITDTNCPNNITFDYTLEAPTQLSTSNTLVSGPALCFGDTVTYNIAATGGTAPYIGTGNYTLPAGIHSIVVTDANGCQTTETITVIEPTELTAIANITSPILCYGGMGQVTVTASGGVPPYIGTGVFNVKSGNFIFTVTDSNGCTYSNNIFVNEPAELSFTIDTIVNPTCSPDWSYSNGTICITITGGTNPFPIGIGWTSLGGGVWCLNGLSAGTHKIDVDDINNCSTNTDSKDIVLTRPPIIDAQITSNVTEDCDNNAMIQTNYIFVTGGSPPYQISWSGGDFCNPFNAQCMETTESGTYIAYIHDQESLANGCPPIEVEVIVDLPEIGDAAFSYSSANNSFCNQLSNNELITFNNESTGDVVNFYWDFGDGSPIIVGEMNPTHLYKIAGSYEVSLTVEYESKCCKETYSEVILVTKGYELKIPNAFTPNQDGINDTIRPLFSCMQNVEMYIYDTWGTLVYTEKGTTILNGWDGNIKGKQAENGNYIMIVKGTTFYGKEISENTSITLIK